MLTTASITERLRHKQATRRHRGGKKVMNKDDSTGNWLRNLFRRSPQSKIQVEPADEHLDAKGWSNRGLNYAKQGNYTEALPCFIKSINLDPGLAPVLYNQGLCLEKLERFTEAITCYDKVIELNPRDAAAWSHKSAMCSELGHQAEAMRCVNQALELDPHSASAWDNKGWIYYGLLDHAEALRCYIQALNIDPNSVSTCVHIGNCLHTTRRYYEALEYYDRALKFDARNIWALEGKARSCDSLGRGAEAIRCYQEYLALAKPQDKAVNGFIQRRIKALRGR